MADIQVTYLRDIVNVLSVTNVVGSDPRTLDVRGPDFSSVVKVEVNEIEAPSYVVMSKTRLLVQVPDSMQNELIRSVNVLSSRMTATDRSQVYFELTDRPQKVTGIQKLVQTFLLFLMRTPGSDAWAPNTGGGVQRLVGSNFSKNATGGITAAFTLAVSRVRTQIISRQARDSRLNTDEKLAAANVLSAIFSAQQTALLARVELISQSGKRAIVGVNL
jgi:hypothetical protein